MHLVVKLVPNQGGLINIGPQREVRPQDLEVLAKSVQGERHGVSPSAHSIAADIERDIFNVPRTIED